MHSRNAIFLLAIRRACGNRCNLPRVSSFAAVATVTKARTAITGFNGNIVTPATPLDWPPAATVHFIYPPRAYSLYSIHICINDNMHIIKQWKTKHKRPGTRHDRALKCFRFFLRSSWNLSCLREHWILKIESFWNTVAIWTEYLLFVASYIYFLFWEQSCQICSN